MDQAVVWSVRAEKSLGQLLRYLSETVSPDYAEVYLAHVGFTLSKVAAHPTKGMIIDRKRMIRRWKLDRHNYATYFVRAGGGIIVHNIFAYARDQKGFPK